ncbi:MAG: DUF4912 domain-containing protein [Nitrospiraceae bacterium]|nr:DUF4912 domain-containing protein [Nitrospiraceae bacterium]
MKKQELMAIGVSGLRALAKKAGIKTEKGWKKEDFVKALSAPKAQKTPQKKSAKVQKKAKTEKARAKKVTPKKSEKKAKTKKAEKPAKKEIKKPLEALTISELKTLAKELGIALKSGLKKADIIKAIGKAKAEKKPKPEKPKKVAAKKPAPKKEEKKVAELPPLPVGYGENRLASMPVTPRQVYVYWEIAEDTISRYQGSLNLKVINTKTNAFFYTPISERIGEQFISVSPATEYTVELGVINYRGEFVRILKSLPVETPVSGIATKEAKKEKEAEEIELPEEFFETPESISSY